MTKSTSERLQHFGVLLHQLLLDLPEHDTITDTLDYILGALYGLNRAHELGFLDRANDHIAAYRAYLANDALNVSRQKPVNEVWLAGFYFNSAIQRIASAFDRIPRMLGAKMEGTRRQTYVKERMTEVNRTPFAKWEEVYDEVNAFKHDPKGKAGGRTVTMSDAVDSFEQMLTLLMDRKPELAAHTTVHK